MHMRLGCADVPIYPAVRFSVLGLFSLFPSACAGPPAVVTDTPATAGVAVRARHSPAAIGAAHIRLGSHE
jgi:hypothetical protein